LSCAATTTRTGLTVHAELDPGSYPDGVKVSDKQMGALPISRHAFHGDWNYTLYPTAGHAAGSADHATDEQEPHAPALPELTGMTAPELDELITRLAAHREERARNNPAGHARHKPRSGRPLSIRVGGGGLGSRYRVRVLGLGSLTGTAQCDPSVPGGRGPVTCARHAARRSSCRRLRPGIAR
jgi:hypothetical protein